MKLILSLKRILVLSFLSLGFISIYPQETGDREFTKAFQNADNYFYYDENYEMAASQYEPLVKSHPDNYNLAAKLGICYLNLDGKKSEALSLLLKASGNFAATAKEYTKTGEKAPLDTYLYLAIAYHQNDSLEKALTIFNDLKKKVPVTENTQNEFLDIQIRDCRYALEMKKKPLRIISELFAPWLIDYPGASNPALAKNDSVFIFTVKNEGKTQVYCSYKNKTWQRPSNITRQLGDYNRFYTNSITGDGKTLILFMDDGGDGNLYYSQRQDTTWSKIRSLGKNINSIYWEAYGFITPDGNTLYFSSNRPGGEGELDIWTSQKDADGSWGRAVNCGNVVNTQYDEDCPYFDPETDALLFSSVGHISLGGYDVFRSIFRNGSWTQPVGIPFAFNDVLDNKDFILNNSAPGFIASRFDSKTNSRNIYGIVAVDPADEITQASGIIKLEDGLEVNPKIALITVKNIKTGTIIQNIPIESDGSFRFDVKPGEYQVLISHDRYKTDTINLSLPLYYAGKYLPVNPTLSPEKVSAGTFQSIKNILFDFSSYEITDEAKQSLEVLKNILTNYPGLTVEVAGYTDAKGSSKFNLNLADKRAQSVINYITSSGVESTLFIKKVFGKSNFAALNSNSDGSDNPEGRKYNRRATIGIVDPQLGIVIRHETYTPEHLRQPYSIRYSVVLTKTKEMLSLGYFNNLIKNDMLFIRTIKNDSAYIYAIGVFYSRTDAVKFMESVREKGLNGAYIINQYDLDNLVPSQNEMPDAQTVPVNIKVYTIQLKAAKGPINIGKVFAGYKDVKENKSDDGYYKYTYGQYESIEKAKIALVTVKKDFEDAFIREINSPVGEKP